MKNKIEACLCYAHPLPHTWYPQVLLIEKRTPLWQRGRFNLPGGKLEPGETPEQAAARELWEETGIQCHIENVHKVGTIDDGDYIVHVCVCRFDSLKGRNQAWTRTDEEVFWMPFQEAFNSNRLLNNLRVIIPLCRSGVTDWVIRPGDMGYEHIQFAPKPTSDAEAEQLIEFDTTCESLSI